MVPAVSAGHSPARRNGIHLVKCLRGYGPSSRAIAYGPRPQAIKPSNAIAAALTTVDGIRYRPSPDKEHMHPAIANNDRGG